MLESYPAVLALKNIYLNIIDTVHTRFLSPNDSEIAYQYILVNIIAFALLLRLGLSYDYIRKSHLSKDNLSLREICKSIFSKEIFFSRSFRVDLGIFFTNLIIFAFLSVLITNAITNPESFFLEKLNRLWISILGGNHSPLKINSFLENVIFTSILFLTYETLYYFAHRAFHYFPILWQFHKVHHSTTQLSFMTDNRFHALEWFGFFVNGGLAAAFSKSLCVYLFADLPNVIAFHGIMVHYAILYSLTLAQHSNLWLSFRRLDYLVVSPAMHMIHHSTDPKNFNTNYALNLATLDYIFGTFKKSNNIPPENLKIGLGANAQENLAWENASILAYFIRPFNEVFKILLTRYFTRMDTKKL